MFAVHLLNVHHVLRECTVFWKNHVHTRHGVCTNGKSKNKGKKNKIKMRINE